MSNELRARVAVATLVLAFNPHQRRDSKGRWTKMPDSELKRPRRRGAGSGAGADVRQLLKRAPGNLEGPEKDAIARLFVFDDTPTGLHTELTSARIITAARGRTELLASLAVRDMDGKLVGTAQRVLRTDPKTGQPVAYHANFELDPLVRGGGFSARWLAQLEERYRQSDIGRIELNTDGVGGYAWAKAGFDFSGSREARKVASRMELLLGSTVARKVGPETRAAAESLIERARAGADATPTPMEFAMVGWVPGAKMWLGKATMLNSKWKGVKEL